jgi:radical SAM protein with 4Fe4S-binding SPASM domain
MTQHKNHNYNTRKPVYIKEDELTAEQTRKLTESETFCMIPWIHMHGIPDGRAYPCCLGEMHLPIGNFKENTMKEVWNGVAYRRMRTNMLNDKSCKECTRCYEQEANGFFSMRNSANKNFGQHIALVDQTKEDGTVEDFKLRYYDVRFSNLCNFSCRTCGSLFSSSWYAEETKLFGKLNHPQIMYAGRDKDDMWEQMQEHIPYLEQIYFAGGEPLIMEEHYRILEELVRRKMFHVRLIYNTNFSHMKLKDKYVFDYWKLFDSVSVGASLDDSYLRGEYMRKGTDWAETVENRRRMIEICPKVDFYISSTVSIYNAWHVADFHKEWVELGLLQPMDWNINILQSPERDRVDVLPLQFKDRIKQRLEEHIAWLEPQDQLQRAVSGYKAIITFMYQDDKSHLLGEFFKINDQTDAHRKEKFEEVFPEYRELRDQLGINKTHDTICMLPWVSIEASPVGTARPCCLAKDEITKPDGTVYKLTENTLEEVYRSPYMQNLRQEFLDGKKPSTCNRCWDEEAAGRTSKRINSRIRLKNYYTIVDWNNVAPDQLWFLDLKLGNICNLKCRICGSWSSSKWAKEEIDYEFNRFNIAKIEGYDRKQHSAYKFLQDGSWPRDNELFWDNLKELLPGVRYFEFTGGEPFLIEEHFKLLRYAVEQEYSNRIDIHYNTNGTVYPTVEEVELWSKFNRVEIAVSIDNVGDRFEYERYGAVWSEVEENIKKFNMLRSNKITTQVCMTINIQNVFYLPELCAWLDTQEFDFVYFNMLHDPDVMCINRMTIPAQTLVIDRLTKHNFNVKHRVEIDKIIQFIQNGVGSDGHEFVQRMKQTDEYRKQNFSTTHKEIAEAMGYDS